MQVGGIGGSGLNSHSSSHHVTNCIHDHGTEKEKTGGMRASSSALTQIAEKQTQEQKMSLLDILRNTVSSGRRFLGRLWGSETGSNPTEVVREMPDGSQNRAAGADPVMAPERSVNHDAGVAAASTAVQAPRTQITDNPYFTTHSDPGKIRENPFAKARVKFRDAAGQLAKRFGGRLGERLAGRFAGKNSMNSGRRKTKEDLRKRSRYKGVEEEIDCVLTDDSYLLDSYDRRGEYTTLTTENKR